MYIMRIKVILVCLRSICIAILASSYIVKKYYCTVILSNNITVTYY